MIKYSTIRNRDFIARCIDTAKNERARGCNPSVRRIVTLTVFGGAGNYYVSFDRAMAMTYKYHNTPTEKRQRAVYLSPSQERARDITVKAEKIVDEQGVSFMEAVTMVLKSKSAPRFYFSVEYGIRLFRQFTKSNVTYTPMKIAV